MRTQHTMPLDLPQLAALVALVEERNVSRAAQREALSQPAMSRHLAAIRERAGDPILVRVGNRFEPTGRALELARAASAILAQMASLLDARPYVPAEDTGTVHIAASDYGEAMLLSTVIARVAREAPGLSVTVSKWDGATLESLRLRRLDFALGVPPKAVPPSIETVTLGHQRLVGLARKGHPLLARKVRPADYVAFGHVVVSTGAGGTVSADEQLGQDRLTRRIQCRAAHFLGAARLVACSDLLMAAPEPLARWLSDAMPVRMFELPVQLPSHPYALMTPSPLEASGRRRWIHDLIVQEAGARAAGGWNVSDG